MSIPLSRRARTLRRCRRTNALAVSARRTAHPAPALSDYFDDGGSTPFEIPR